MTQIYIWKCTLRSISPLHIGGDEGEIVTDQNGHPFIPGTSIAGACRAYVQTIAEKKEVETLFGSPASQARDTVFMISDGRCRGNYMTEFRPGIRIDGATKTAENGAFFERQLLVPGASFDVTFTLKTEKRGDKLNKYKEIVENMLLAIHSGIIRFGAYKSVGSGKFAIESCGFVHYDCTNEEDLLAYVDESKPYQRLLFSETYTHEGIVQISLKGRTKTPILIGGQKSNDSSEPDRTYMRTADGKPMIPGSSLKGVLRHRINRITNIMQLQDKNKYIYYLFGADDPKAEEGTGTLRFEDIVLNEINTKKYNRIAINPFTGGTKDGAFLEEETVIGTFETNLHLELRENEERLKENERNVSLALLLFALRDLALERMTVGSGAAIGRGFLEIESMRMKKGDKEVVFNFKSGQITDEQGWLVELQDELKWARKGEKQDD